MGTYGVHDLHNNIVLHDGATGFGLTLNDVIAYMDERFRGDGGETIFESDGSTPVEPPLSPAVADKQPGWLTRAGRWLAGFGM